MDWKRWVTVASGIVMFAWTVLVILRPDHPRWLGVIPFICSAWLIYYGLSNWPRRTP